MYRLLIGIAIGLLIQGCGKQEQAASQSEPQATAAPKAPAFVLNSIDSSKIKQIAPGLKLYVVQEGSGVVPKTGEMVIAHYHGTFLDGKKFDSSYERGEPYVFPLGQGQVIQAWDKAFAVMKVGTKAVIIAGPEVAYGERGMGSAIPPNATLRFDVELLGANAASVK